MNLDALKRWWMGVNKRLLIETVLVFLVTFGVTALARWELGFTYPVGRKDIPAGVCATLGDVCIYAAVLILGAPRGAIVCALAMAGADLAVGSKLFVIGTILIKFFMAYFVAGCVKNCRSFKQYLALAGITESGMVLLYFFYGLIFVNYTVAAEALPVDLLQGVVCALLGAVVMLKLPPQRPRSLPRFRRSAPGRRYGNN